MTRITDLLLKITGRWFNFGIFRENVNSWARLEWSELKYIFHWWTKFEIFLKLLFNLLVDFVTSWTMRKEMYHKQKHGICTIQTQAS